jgi:hypothetical protein
MRRYQHTQIAWVTIGAMGVAVVVAAAGVARAAENLVPAVLLSVFLLTPVLFFGTFTVTVTDDEIILRSGVGLFRTRIPVDAVRSYERVRNPWYYGWGIHTIPRRTLYNQSGFEAVIVSLVDGTHLRIGTDDGDALMDAFRRVVPEHAVQGTQARVSHVNPILAVLAFLFVPALLVVALMFYVSTRAVAVTVTPDQISVSGGIYRDEIRVQDVESISLELALPAVLERTNGFVFGNSLRGHFLLQGAGDAHLFVERDSPPYVKLRTRRHVVWINFKDPRRTRDLYATLIGTGVPSR